MSDKYAELRTAEPAPTFDDWPDYHGSGMGCGLEDRGIRDRYEAMRHGWECALERVAERLPDWDSARVVVGKDMLAELLAERDALAAELAELRKRDYAAIADAIQMPDDIKGRFGSELFWRGAYAMRDACMAKAPSGQEEGDDIR